MMELGQPSQATLRDDVPVRLSRGGRIAFGGRKRPESVLRLLEVAQVGRRLVLLGRHQEPLDAEKIVLLADDDLCVLFSDVILRSVRA